MIGDNDDLLARLKAAIPGRWFGTDTPILDGLLSGPATALSKIYSTIQYAILQTRIKTATDGWLDLIARDFFGRFFQRRPTEGDDSYRARILKEIFRPRVTRAAMIEALTDLTGRAPIIFEPARVADTGSLGHPTFAFGGAGYPMSGITADSTTITDDTTVITSDAGQVPYTGVGAWGSLNYVDQCFIIAFRPPGEGIPDVAGFYVPPTLSASGSTATDGMSFFSSPPPTGTGYYPGGYGGYVSTGGGATDGMSFFSGDSASETQFVGGGNIEFASLASLNGPVTDADIYSTIDRVKAAGVTPWTWIQS